jgi:hypothetical protein
VEPAVDFANDAAYAERSDSSVGNLRCGSMSALSQNDRKRVIADEYPDSVDFASQLVRTWQIVA